MHLERRLVMKARVTKVVTLELSIAEARTLYQIANWGDLVAELVGEKSADKKVGHAVDELLDDIFNVLDDLEIITE